jgi:glutamine cyclotransferase
LKKVSDYHCAMKTTLLVAVWIVLLLGTARIFKGYASAESVEAAVDGQPRSAPPIIPVYRYRIIHTYPHDRHAFTQGLVFDNGDLYESTGLHGHSTLRKVRLATGKVLKLHRLPEQLFGEGITVLGGKLYQLTWQSGLGFVYDKQSFEVLRDFTYATEGWGLTHDGRRLIMSDGSSMLHYLDAETFEEVGRITVHMFNRRVTRLNALAQTI